MLSKQEMIEMENSRKMREGGRTEADGYTDSPLVVEGHHVMGVFEGGPKGPEYYLEGKKVDRVTWMRDGLSKLLDREMPNYVDRLEKKAFGNIKNYLHNTLGVTRSYVYNLIADIVRDELKKIVREILGLEPAQNAVQSAAFASLVRREIVEQIRLLSKVHSFEDYIKKQVQEQIHAHVVSRLKVDIRVKTVDPEEGVDREVISPEPFRGVREV